MRVILNNPLVVGGLCLIAGVILYLNGTGSSLEPMTGKVATPIKTAMLPAKHIGGREKIGTIEIDKLGWTDSVVRDPFGPMLTQDEARVIKNFAQGRGQSITARKRSGAVARRLRSLKLNAISVEPHSRMAVINRSIVKENDRIKGFRVQRIEPDNVMLKGSSGTYRLTFNRKQETRERD